MSYGLRISFFKHLKLMGRQFFTHERGLHMGIYAFTLAGSNYFAPIICGFIAEYQGWRWVCGHAILWL
jgi:MFS family permease